MGPAEIPAKRRYTFQDTQRWAVHVGLKFRRPAHPFNPLKPLRATSAIDDDGLREALAVKLLDAAWSEGRDINSDGVIDEVASSIGVKGQELLGKGWPKDIRAFVYNAMNSVIGRCDETHLARCSGTERWLTV